MEPHCFIATTPVQFVRKVAIDYLRFGYVRYKRLDIPNGKDIGSVEGKLFDCYDIIACRTTRSRRRSQGAANVVFVRYHRFVVLLATEGVHPQFDKLVWYDFRYAPLHFSDYTVGLHHNTPCVRVGKAVWSEVERRFERIALHRQEELERKINSLPYARFPGVISQKIALVSRLNRRRKRAGLPPIALSHGRTRQSSAIAYKFPRRSPERG